MSRGRTSLPPALSFEDFGMTVVIAILVTLLTLPIMLSVWLVFRIAMWFTAEKSEEDKNRTTLYSPGKMW